MGLSRVFSGWGSPPPPTSCLLPHPQGTHLGFFQSLSPLTPQGKDHLQRFVWECLFLPFPHHVREGLEVQSPPVARTTKGHSQNREE